MNIMSLIDILMMWSVMSEGFTYHNSRSLIIYVDCAGRTI
jgi:hypothetical protein